MINVFVVYFQRVRLSAQQLCIVHDAMPDRVSSCEREKWSRVWSFLVHSSLNGDYMKDAVGSGH